MKVFRNGKWNDSSHRDYLMTGDIIELNTGDEIPADCLILSSNELKADESVMTGEPDAVDKEPMGVCIKKRD